MRESALKRAGEIHGTRQNTQLHHQPRPPVAGSTVADRLFALGRLQVRSLAAELLPDPGNGGVGCTDSAVGAGSVSLGEHGAAAANQAGAQIGDIESYQAGRPGHEPGDGCNDGGDAVMGGIGHRAQHGAGEGRGGDGEEAALGGGLGLLMLCFDDKGAGAVRRAIVTRARAFEKVADVIPAAMLAYAALYVGPATQKVLERF